MRTNILGVGFDPITPEEAVLHAQALLESPGTHYIVTPNPEVVYRCQSDRETMEAVQNADLVLADGIGIVMGAQMLGHPLPGRVPGIEFAQSLMGVLANSGHGLFLLGAKPGVAQEAAERLCLTYPGLRIAGVMDGYFSDDEHALAAIRQAKPDVLFVCLGVPRQEIWMRRHKVSVGAKLMVGLGGSLDVWAGRVSRAPAFMSRMGLEWLHRLVKQPSRLWRMRVLPLFLWRVFLSKKK